MSEVNKLEINMAKMEEKVDNIEKKVDSIAISIDRFHDTFRTEMRDFKCEVNDSLRAKANLWVEWFCKSLLGAIIVAGIGLIVIAIKATVGI